MEAYKPKRIGESNSLAPSVRSKVSNELSDVESFYSIHSSCSDLVDNTKLSHAHNVEQLVVPFTMAPVLSQTKPVLVRIACTGIRVNISRGNF